MCWHYQHTKRDNATHLFKCGSEEILKTFLLGFLMKCLVEFLFHNTFTCKWDVYLEDEVFELLVGKKWGFAVDFRKWSTRTLKQWQQNIKTKKCWSFFNQRELTESLPLRDLRCCTAIRSTVSLSSFRDIGLQVGIMADSLSMRLFILSRLLFSIWLWGSLKVNKECSIYHYCQHMNH